VEVRARREVILCAGALASPKMLMLSGIGPAVELRRHDISVLLDAPAVGRDLQEHPAVSVMHEVTHRTLNQDLTPARLFRHALAFAVRGGGALTSTASHAIAFAPLGMRPTRDIQLVFMAYGVAPVSTGSDGTAPTPVLRRLLSRRGVAGGAGGDRERAPASEPLVTTQAVLLRPTSRGAVTLRSADPADPPLIDHPLLGAAADVDQLTAALRVVRRIFSAPALAAVVVVERLPGADVPDRALGDYVRAAAFRMSHPTSTCRMGNAGDAVVDTCLRVIGTTGLRVVDASVLPTVPRANTNAAVIAAAERASDLISAQRSGSAAPR
jgi:choline dehydrogenase